MTHVVVPRAADLHVHLRQGQQMCAVAPYTSAQCAYALLMPNTLPPVADAAAVEEYRRAAVSALGGGCSPLMTIKLTPQTSAATVRAAKEAGAVAAKLYPAGVTTHSDDGIPQAWLERPPASFQDVLAALEEEGMVLCVHGEWPRGEAPPEGLSLSPWIAKRTAKGRLHAYTPHWLTAEDYFLPTFRHWATGHPRLRMVLEHVTTREGVETVRRLAGRGLPVAATITDHHLLLSSDDVLEDVLGGGRLNAHNHCRPPAKSEYDRRCLQEAAVSGEPWFFSGTDSAPHSPEAKCRGCAGVFTAPLHMQLLASVFESLDAMDQLAAFSSGRGCRFYGLDRPGGTLRLEREGWQVPETAGGVVPFLAGRELPWSCES